MGNRKTSDCLHILQHCKAPWDAARSNPIQCTVWNISHEPLEELLISFFMRELTKTQKPMNRTPVSTHLATADGGSCHFWTLTDTKNTNDWRRRRLHSSASQAKERWGWMTSDCLRSLFSLLWQRSDGRRQSWCRSDQLPGIGNNRPSIPPDTRRHRRHRSHLLCNMNTSPLSEIAISNQDLSAVCEKEWKEPKQQFLAWSSNKPTPTCSNWSQHINDIVSSWYQCSKGWPECKIVSVDI